MLGTDDVGSTIRVVITASNAYGSSSIDSGQTPTVIAGLPVTEGTLSAGGQHTCSIYSGGTVGCWGINVYGQLGNNTTDNNSTPVQVKGVAGVGTLSNVTQISAGGEDSCALLSGGTVDCWGLDSFGGLTMDLSSTPVQVSGIANATRIEAGPARHALSSPAEQSIAGVTTTSAS